MTPPNSSQGGENEGSGATAEARQPALVASLPEALRASAHSGDGQAQSDADVLERAADLLAAPGAWTQGDYARDGSGTPITRRNNNPAVCWCALGAIRQIGRYDKLGLFDDNPAANLLATLMDGGSVSDWNDAPDRTQDEVVSKLREAASKARSEQGA